ncbi:MAG: HAD-IA family hydrolase [Gemmataceae bacterium]
MLNAGIRAVYFDAVGTLIFPNPPASAVYAQVAGRHGQTIDPAVISPLLWQQFQFEDDLDRQFGWGTSEERERRRWRNIVSAALPGSSDQLFDELFHHFAQPSAWIVPDDAARTLTELTAAGYRVGIASNYDRRLETVVGGSAALAPVRGRLVISSVVGVRKPGAGFFDAVITSAGCEPEEILFVGDDLENDYHGATAAGLTAVLLDPKDKHPETERRVRSLGELL